MKYLTIILVCFFSSTVGAVCGIGGGVIIKPVLDALEIVEVTSVSFLSGCTVLSMAVVSLYKNLRKRDDFEFDNIFATILALGSVVGGVVGRESYQQIINHLENRSAVAAVQAGILALVTFGTLAYTLFKKKIPAKNIKNRMFVFVTGIVLGMMSAFLGIGGGPINLVVLFYFFSMETKQAALNSIYVIMFSQISSLSATLFRGNMPPVDKGILLLMVLGGVSGGLVGCRINRKIESETVDKLFMCLMGVIIFISVYNFFLYIS